MSVLPASDGNAKRVDLRDDARMSENATSTGPAQRRRRGRPAKLSRPAIFAAAVKLIDRGGEDALTMRSLAGVLGVEAMSLYRHVASKEELLDGAAEELFGEIQPRGVSSDWTEGVRGFASSVRGLAHEHPRAFSVLALRALGSAGALQPVEDLLASLRAGGFTPARTVAAYRVIAAYTRGYALSEIAGFALGDPDALGARFPTIRVLSRQLASEPSQGSFRAGLELIINGLRAERER
jgi:AcrR family transcriptional regulator